MPGIGKQKAALALVAQRKGNPRQIEDGDVLELDARAAARAVARACIERDPARAQLPRPIVSRAGGVRDSLGSMRPSGSSAISPAVRAGRDGSSNSASLKRAPSSAEQRPPPPRTTTSGSRYSTSPSMRKSRRAASYCTFSARSSRLPWRTSTSPESVASPLRPSDAASLEISMGAEGSGGASTSAASSGSAPMGGQTGGSWPKAQRAAASASSASHGDGRPLSLV